MSEHKEPIPSMLYNAAVGGHVTNSQQIIDEVLNKEQSVINVEQQELNKGILEEKEYTSGSNNGMGRVVLRKNMVNGVNILTQSMINKSNTIYVIQYDFTLGENITVPENCVLEFDGGSINSGNYIISGDFLPSELNVLNFGLKGDGVTDNTAAFSKMITTINSLNIDNFTNTIYFPKGKYVFDSNSPLRPLTRAWKDGLCIRGASKNSTLLVLKTNNEERWFWDNNGQNGYAGHVHFKDITFISDNVLYANGFKLYSIGHEKKYYFTDCNIYLNLFMQIDGTTNGDLNIFTRCDIHCISIMKIANPESCINRFTCCSLFAVKDGFILEDGGDIRINQCNIEMHNTASDTNGSKEIYSDNDDVRYYLFKTIGSSTSTGTGTLSVTSSRFEFWNKSGLADLKAYGYEVKISDSCVGKANGLISTIIGNNTAIICERFSIREDFYFGIGISEQSSVNDVQLPLLILRNCNVSRLASDELVYINSDKVRVVVDGCYNNTIGVSQSPNQCFSYDYIPVDNNYGDRISPKEKVITPYYRMNYQYFTTDVTKSMLCVLPKYAKITKILWSHGISSNSATRTITIKGIDNNDTETVIDTFEITLNVPLTKYIECFYNNIFKSIKVEIEPYSAVIKDLSFYVFYI